MFSNRVLLANIKAVGEPIDIYSSGGATHCDTAGTLKNIGNIYLHENGLVIIMSYTKVTDRRNIMYDDVRDIFTVHASYKRIHIRSSKRGLHYHNCKPNGKKHDVPFVKTAQENCERFTNREIKDVEKARYIMVGRPSAADFERMVRENMLNKYPIIVINISMFTQYLAPTPDPSGAKQKEKRLKQ